MVLQQKVRKWQVINSGVYCSGWFFKGEELGAFLGGELDGAETLKFEGLSEAKKGDFVGKTGVESVVGRDRQALRLRYQVAV